MTHIGTLLSPNSCLIAICKLNKIKCIVNPRTKFIKWDLSLMMRIVCCRKYWKRLCTYILCQLEIFIIAKTKCLIISPVISSRWALLHRSNRIFPAIHRISCILIKLSVMYKTASRKTYELRMHCFEHLA